MGETVQKLAHLEGLCDVIRSPRLQQTHGLVDPPLTRDEKKGRRCRCAAKCCEQFLPCPVWQADIANHGVNRGARRAQRPDGPLHQFDPNHVRTFQTKALVDGRSHDLIIFDQRDAASLQHGAVPPRGRMICTVDRSGDRK